MATDLKAPVDEGVDVGEYQYGFHDPVWMREFRLNALEIFFKKPLPTWGGRLADLNFQDIHYYVRASANQEKSWDDVPEDIRRTYDRLGIPEAEKKYLAGVKAQYESEV